MVEHAHGLRQRRGPNAKSSLHKAHLAPDAGLQAPGGRTKAAVELATLEWVSWFNHQRLLASIGDIPPAEAEERYYRQLAAPAAEPVLL
ncbi:integrase catalytic subunit [Pseudomonas aeruginosa VRFPA02]|nr:integrase catalytic subunit [Pseudomonas aeruginosa VRFPA02]